jgi:hypothetical protein
MSWREYIERHFDNPRREVGVIFVTCPCSLTGRETDRSVIEDLLNVAEELNIKVVLNQVHATPSHDGHLSEGQSLIARSRNKNLVVITSATKQVMPYAVAGLERQPLNVFYSPDPVVVAAISREVERASTTPQDRMMIDPAKIPRAVELLKASNNEFFVGNQQRSLERRLIVDNWLSSHPDVEWYYGVMPQTGYHASLTFRHELLDRADITNPHELYDYLLFSSGLDVAPIFDEGPRGAKNDSGDLSVRVNYSFPEPELQLSLALLDVAVENMRQGVTLEQIRQYSDRPHTVKLKAAGDAAAPVNNGQGGEPARLLSVHAPT